MQTHLRKYAERGQRFLAQDDAVTSVEYAVVLALLLMVAFAAIALFGNNTNQTFTKNNDSLKAVNFGS
jgi:Flp pilus assembly pilin Flp